MVEGIHHLRADLHTEPVDDDRHLLRNRHVVRYETRTVGVDETAELARSGRRRQEAGIGTTIGSGIVAKIRESAIVGPSAQMPASDRQPKQLVDKLQLREWVTLPTHLARPFRIMWTASIPCNVRQAVENDWYPLASQTRFFETR